MVNSTTIKRTFKPSTQLSGKPVKYKTWDTYTVGDVLILKYVKPMANKFNESKPNHCFEVLEAMFKSKSDQKEITEGTWLVLNTMGKLDKAILDIEAGQIIQVTYNGKKEMTAGVYKGKSAHDVDVMLMEEDGEETEESNDDEYSDEEYFDSDDI